MAFELPTLPYAMNALEPHMSAKTFEFHYGKHHKAYVDNANRLVQDTPFAGKSLEEIIAATRQGPDPRPAFSTMSRRSGTTRSSGIR